VRPGAGRGPLFAVLLVAAACSFSPPTRVVIPDGALPVRTPAQVAEVLGGYIAGQEQRAGRRAVPPEIRLLLWAQGPTDVAWSAGRGLYIPDGRSDPDTIAHANRDFWYADVFGTFLGPRGTVATRAVLRVDPATLEVTEAMTGER
jgi:hypothetical protein